MVRRTAFIWQADLMAVVVGHSCAPWLVGQFGVSQTRKSASLYDLLASPDYTPITSNNRQV